MFGAILVHLKLFLGEREGKERRWKKTSKNFSDLSRFIPKPSSRSCRQAFMGRGANLRRFIITCVHVFVCLIEERRGGEQVNNMTKKQGPKRNKRGIEWSRGEKLRRKADVFGRTPRRWEEERRGSKNSHVDREREGGRERWEQLDWVGWVFNGRQRQRNGRERREMRERRGGGYLGSQVTRQW